MANSGNAGNIVPANVPGEDLTSEDMARVTADDWADIQRLSRGYCRTVDATRSRKRMDGSATVVKGGHAPYGTDDISDDVTQDAVLTYAAYLRNVIKSRPSASHYVDTRETASWQYTRKDGQTCEITRATLQRWAVRDTARRYGYRLDVNPDDVEATPGTQLMRGVSHVESITPTPSAASIVSEATWRTAWGDGQEYPVLRAALFLASEADDLGREGILATVAQAMHGGARNSRRQVIRTRNAGEQEWAELSQELGDVRAQLTSASLETLQGIV